MLTAAHRVYHWDRRTSAISSDRLEDAALPALEPALAVYRERIGQTRGQVRNAARAALDGLRPDRVEPVVKLLDDTASYEWPKSGRWSERRVAVFEAAGARHPVLETNAAHALLGVAFPSPLPAPTETVGLLYADYPEYHRLAAFPADYSAESLRADYDLAQAQALLYSATRITVDAGGDFKHILRYARLARLLHHVERIRANPETKPAGRRWRSASRAADGNGYRFVLDGPNSLLRRTRAYGVDFARFLAALVRLGDWRLQARIELRKGWRPFTFALTSADGLGAGASPPPEFDSALEAAIARKFRRERAGWRLLREGMILELGRGAVLVPDFVFRHHDGAEVVLEIVGYWTPEYLSEKFRKLAAARGVNRVVAVPTPLAVRAGRLPAAVIPFKRRLLLRDLLPRLAAFRRPGASGDDASPPPRPSRRPRPRSA